MTTLTGELSFATAEGALEQAAPQVENGEGTVEIDLAGVTRVDSAGLALLLELARRAGAAKREIRFSHPPAHLARLAGFFGVASLLGLKA